MWFPAKHPTTWQWAIGGLISGAGCDAMFVPAVERRAFCIPSIHVDEGWERVCAERSKSLRLTIQIKLFQRVVGLECDGKRNRNILFYPAGCRDKVSKLNKTIHPPLETKQNRTWQVANSERIRPQSLNAFFHAIHLWKVMNNPLRWTTKTKTRAKTKSLTTVDHRKFFWLRRGSPNSIEEPFF